LLFRQWFAASCVRTVLARDYGIIVSGLMRDLWTAIAAFTSSSSAGTVAAPHAKVYNGLKDVSRNLSPDTTAYI
jgi:hypothetical protein